jgi:hypothetical protein
VTGSAARHLRSTGQYATDSATGRLHTAEPVHYWWCSWSSVYNWASALVQHGTAGKQYMSLASCGDGWWEFYDGIYNLLLERLWFGTCNTVLD